MVKFRSKRKGEIFSIDFVLLLTIISFLLFSFIILQYHFERDQENFEKLGYDDFLIKKLNFTNS